MYSGFKFQVSLPGLRVLSLVPPPWIGKTINVLDYIRRPTSWHVMNSNLNFCTMVSGSADFNRYDIVDPVSISEIHKAVEVGDDAKGEEVFI